MLTILTVSHPLSVVRPDSVGGAEQIVSTLDRAIVAAGHRSIVVAPEGSLCAGELLPIATHAGPLDTAAFYACHDSCRRQIACALAHEAVDVVHMHGIDFIDYAPRTDVPILATLHMWPNAYPARVFTNRRRQVHLQCVSHAQQRACPRGVEVSVIPNGVDVDAFSPASAPEDFVLVLGRICPEKGVHLAIDAARAARMPLVIAGTVFPYPNHQHYFEQAIAPRLGDDVRFVGPLAGSAKRRMLALARCVMVPSLVRETSSLSTMEALASGTPVIAFRGPALEEIVEQGRTGWLVDATDDLPVALHRLSELSREACRASAVARCSAAPMTQRYLSAYGRLADRQHARRSPVTATSAAATPIRATPLASVGDLERLVEPWRELANCCPWSTPFQTPEWLLPWTRNFAGGVLTGAAFWRGTRLLGLVPLVATRRNGEALLQMAGTGISDYLSPLATQDSVSEVSACLLSMIADGAFGAGSVEIEQIFPDHPLLHAVAPMGATASVSSGEVCPVVDLSRGGAAIPEHMRANLRYYWRRAGRRGRARIDVPTSMSLCELTDALFTLHAARWSNRGSAGMLASADLQSFHRDAIRALHAQGMLAMHALRLDDRIVAIWYGMAWKRRAYFYLAGFDPEYGDVSPGTLVIDAAIQRSVERGASTFDFLRGTDPYKYLWGARDTQTARWKLNACARDAQRPGASQVA